MSTAQKTTKEKTPVILKPDEQAALEQGLRSEATGKDHSMEEVFAMARKRRKAWTKSTITATA